MVQWPPNSYGIVGNRSLYLCAGDKLICGINRHHTMFLHQNKLYLSFLTNPINN